jgi:hypothetical protein
MRQLEQHDPPIFQSDPFAVNKLHEAEDAESIHREFKILCRLTNPNVIPLFDYFEALDRFRSCSNTAGGLHHGQN